MNETRNDTSIRLKLTDEEKTQLVPQAIARYLSENEASQADLARLAGVSKAYVNQIAQGKTTIGQAQIADKYFRKIAHAIELNIEPTYWKHFDTKNFLQACLAIDNARKNRERLGLDEARVPFSLSY